MLCLPAYGQNGTGEKCRSLSVNVGELIDSLKHVYVPDSRVALFDVNYMQDEAFVMLCGVTTESQAKVELLATLQKQGYQVVDRLHLLPDAALGQETYAVVRLSVCNLHAAPDFSSEMVSQALLGMPVRVLQYNNWYRIQTPDRYIAWVHRAAIQLMDDKELAMWNRSEKLIVTANYGIVRSAPDLVSCPVSDVVAGDRFRLVGEEKGFYRVLYPDGRVGYLEKSLGMPESRWRLSLKDNVSDILQTAYRFLGVPYFWAGMSSKGMDCSGFIRTVFYLHDIIMPRDASQQASVGQRIEIGPDCKNLQAGDLLFFGRKATAGQKEQIVHVGMYIGEGRFIHSQGDVHISSLFSSDTLFDAFNLNRLLFANRIIPYINKQPELTTTQTNSLYQVE